MENTSRLTRLRVGLSALQQLVHDPTDPNYGPLFIQSIDGGVHASLASELSRHEEGRRLLAERPLIGKADLDLEPLARLPPGTLGHEFARYFREQGLEPIVTPSPASDDARYIGQRLRDTHDLHHLVTGYGTDSIGELELQAFQFGNLGTLTSLFALVVGVKRNVPAKIKLGVLLRRLWAAFRRGRASRQIASFHWEDHWETPVERLSELLCAPA